MLKQLISLVFLFALLHWAYASSDNKSTILPKSKPKKISILQKKQQKQVLLPVEKPIIKKNIKIATNNIVPKEKIKIRADTRQLSQVLTNLLQNAIDAIDGRDATGVDQLPAGEIVLSVELNADKSAAVLSVQDNGRGLPPNLKDRLTEPYVTTRAKGTGLGLAIVKTILEDHGASLDLRDSANGGAAVTVTIPLHDGPTDNNRGDLANDA